MTVSAAGAAPWYARALGSTPTEPRPQDAEPTTPPSRAPMSLDDVSPRAKNNLLELAGSLGTEPDALLAHLSSGQTLSSLLPNRGESGYGPAAAPSAIGGLAIDEYV